MIAGEKLRRRTRALLQADLEAQHIRLNTGDARVRGYYLEEISNAENRIKLLDKAEARWREVEMARRVRR